MSGVLSEPAISYGDYFERRFAYLLLLVTLPLLFLPKINLFTMGEETAGLRVDDLLLFFSSFALLWGFLQTSISHSPPVKAIFGWTALALFSCGWNFYFNSVDWIALPANPLYALRLFEYFLFFFIGILSVRYFSTSLILFLVLGLNLGVAFLQKGGIVGAFTVEGYKEVVSERVMGITSFPNELGITLNLLFCALAFRKSVSTTVGLLVLCATTLLIVWSGSRISLAAQGVLCLAYLWERPTARVWAFLSAPLMAIVLGALLISTDSLSSRSQELGNVSENIAVLTKVWDRIDPQTTDWDATIMREEVDASWWLRIHKWCHALKLYLSNPAFYLTGVGPGVAKAALDGGLLRILVEMGILGLLAFAVLLRSISRKNRMLQWMAFALILNMIFIDAHLSYKAMSLFFFIAGTEWSFRDDV